MNRELQILLVEDHTSDAELIKYELRKANISFSSRLVETKEDFITIVKDFAPDIILSDYNLPGFSGLSALRWIKEQKLSIAFILVTGTQSEEVAVECIKEGADDYILKSSLKRLPSAVLSTLQKKETEREKEKTEEALRQSEERYRDLFENAKDIIYIHDLDGKITSMNKTGEQITGYSRDEALTLNIGQIIRQGYPTLVQPLVSQESTGEVAAPIALEIITKSGQRVAIEVSLRLIHQKGKPVGVQGIARDVTERKLLEEQLRQAQKMEAVGRLAGGVAHDFNNLLTAITGYSELLLARLSPGMPMQKEVEEIKKAGDRATLLTRQLLAFSRKQILAPEVMNLNAVLMNMEKMLRRLIGEDIHLVFDLQPELGRVKADSGQIEQVILNLAINARDAMPQGGKLTIETGTVSLDENSASRYLSLRPASYVMLVVRDTGHGIDAETQSRIFEPFFTTKEQGKGTGLGLSTVYGIVKQSGGDIWVYSEPGQGATFKICLPQIQEAPQTPKPVQVSLEAARGSETILLVEDEQVVRNLVRTILQRNGYTVLEASHGSEALRIAGQHQGPIDLMITDVVMPQMSGKELAERLAPQRPEMKVLYVSGYTDDAVVRHGVLNSRTHFLQKPFTPNALALKVRELLDNSFKAI